MVWGEKVAAIQIKKNDYIVVVAILIWGLVGFWFNIQQAGAAQRKYATIYVQNEHVAELSLSTNEQYSYSFQFGEQGEHTAHVEVDGGRIRMLALEDDLCPKHICSHTGWIEYGYEKIVCLPNQIMIVFNNASRTGDQEELDGVTY